MGMYRVIVMNQSLGIRFRVVAAFLLLEVAFPRSAVVN
jgi:hypothetical protein